MVELRGDAHRYVTNRNVRPKDSPHPSYRRDRFRVADPGLRFDLTDHDRALVDFAEIFSASGTK